MKKNYFIPLILLLIAGIGGYFAIVLSRGEPSQQEDTSGKPTAQSHRSYEVEIVSGVTNVKPEQPTSIVYKIKDDKGEILKDFEVAHEKIMHFILVRHDLQNFQHLHPEYNKANGEFTVIVTFPTDGPYRLFPDFTPEKSQDNPQLLPVTVYFDLTVGDIRNYQPVVLSTDINKTKTFGRYLVTFLFNPPLEDLRAQKEIVYSLNIKRNGQAVQNLETYLGALGHSVILKEKTLDFIHTHAFDPSAEDVQTEPGLVGHVMKPATKINTGPTIDFSTSLPEPGIYKIFTQFQHEGKVITTDYVLRVNE